MKMKRRLMLAGLLGMATLGVAHSDEWDEVDRGGLEEWPMDPEFPDDAFTFVRIKYSSSGGRRRGGGGWATDFPDGDLNLSYRLQQLTSMKVKPRGKVIELTDPALHDYPFIYFVEPGRLQFSDEEVKALRHYLTSGGFMMVDDFWGQDEWDNFEQEFARVFPERRLVELDISHPVFKAVFPLQVKPQVPSIHNWERSGQSYERPWEADKSPHYRALFDDRGRMMAIVCHNTDLGDGWEREGESREYFRLFSEPLSYPMGINILFHAMTR